MTVRKLFSCLLFLLSYASSNVYSQRLSDIVGLERNHVINETFDDNARGWLTESQYLSGRIENGKYVLKCKNYKGTAGLSYISTIIDMLKDFEIEASLRIISGKGGVLFGMNNSLFHYRVEFDEKGVYVVKNAENLEKIFSKNDDYGIRSGSYFKVTISKVKDTYFLFINDSFIRKFTDISTEGSKLGFYVGVKSEMEIDYLNFSYLQKIEVSPLAKRNVVKNDSINQSKNVIDSVVQPKTKAIQVPYNSLQISWTSPSSERVNIQEYTARIKATVRSDFRLLNVLFYINGISAGEGEFKQDQNKIDNYIIDKLITLKPGENSVYFIATSEKESGRSPLRFFINPETNPPVLEWINPTDLTSVVNNRNIIIEGSVKSSLGVNSMIILVNGVPQVEDRSLQNNIASVGKLKYQRNIILKEGENSIYIIAANNAGSTQSEERIITYNKNIPEKRLAFIVGNSEYGKGVSLKNPVNDVNLIEGTLKDLGFVIIKKLNIGRDSMMSSIREFSRKLASYNVALFYYAGHGIQVDGINYLIPTDAQLNEKDDCKWEAVAVSTVTDELKKYSTSTNIVILDACRTNPFRSWVRGENTGFKALAPINGTIISFATSEGGNAADGIGSNGLFTEELVKQMNISQPIETVFKNTRKNVMQRSNNQQTPVEWSYLIGDFYFKK